MGYLVIVIWLLITTFSLAWVDYNHPELRNWVPSTFPQFVLTITIGLAWFILCMFAILEVNKKYDGE